MNVDLGSQPNAMAHISVMSAHVHLTVRDHYSERFWAEQRRRQYVTPRTFVELLMVFSQTVVKKRAALEASIDRLHSGLNKLHNAETLIDKLQVGIAPNLVLAGLTRSRLLHPPSNSSHFLPPNQSPLPPLPPSPPRWN